MDTIIRGKNFEVTDKLQKRVNDKLGKLDKYFTSETKATVTLSAERGREKIEVTIPVRDGVIRSEQTSGDMYTSLDLAEESIERQMRKYKDKIVQRHHAGGNFQQEYLDTSYEEDETIKIERTKTFDPKPMYPEDACLELELVGHDFFVFVNAETDQVNVVYKRKNGNYGLIEPEE